MLQVIFSPASNKSKPTKHLLTAEVNETLLAKKENKKWVSTLHRTAQPFILAAFLPWGGS